MDKQRLFFSYRMKSETMHILSGNFKNCALLNLDPNARTKKYLFFSPNPKKSHFFVEEFSENAIKKKRGGIIPSERARRARLRDPPSGSPPSKASEFVSSPFRALERGRRQRRRTPSPADERSEEKGEGATNTHNHAHGVLTTGSFH